MAWVAVDEDGMEVIYTDKPYKGKVKWLTNELIETQRINNDTTK